MNVGAEEKNFEVTVFVILGNLPWCKSVFTSSDNSVEQLGIDFVITFK